MAILTVPSWVIPGSYAENLSFLEHREEIRGVELLFFSYDDEARSTLDSDLAEIRKYRERFLFTAHLPDLLLSGHEDLIARLSPLVRHFIVHPEKAPRPPRGNGETPQDAVLGEWERRYGAAFLTENVTQSKNGRYTRRPEDAPPRADGKPDLCMDTGHLLLDGRNPADYFKTWGKRVGEIHLHGIDREASVIDGRSADHRGLRGNIPWLIETLPLLKGYEGVINLEVFSWEEAAAGIETLKRFDLFGKG